MPTSVKTGSFRQRAEEATHHLREILGLSDSKLLNVAVAQAAADEAVRNHAFRTQIVRLYDELAALNPRQRKRRSSKPRDVNLVPLPDVVGVHIDPFASFDPYAMYNSTRMPCTSCTVPAKCERPSRNIQWAP